MLSSAVVIAPRQESTTATTPGSCEETFEEGPTVLSSAKYMSVRDLGRLGWNVRASPWLPSAASSCTWDLQAPGVTSSCSNANSGSLQDPISRPIGGGDTFVEAPEREALSAPEEPFVDVVVAGVVGEEDAGHIGVDDTLCHDCDEEAQDGGALPAPPEPRAPPLRAKQRGRLSSHVRFLQHLFRGYRRQRPSAWSRRGGLKGLVVLRPVTMFRCRGGMCLAAQEEVEAQRQRGLEVIEHYSIYVDLLSRLKNRRARSYHPFAAAGADAEGVRRVRGVPFGSDLLDQPEFRAHFGERAFQVGDAAQRSTLEAVYRSWAPDVTLASPPCQPYSTADMQGATKAKRMIPLIRGYLESLGGLYAIENVKGAAKEMLPHAVLLYGSFFGLGVDRPRFFEANFPIVVDEYLRGPGLALRLRSCLGPRRKWRRLDPFGRPEALDCCRGNLYPIQGSHPAGFTVAEGAAAMGVDVTHMPFERLSQAIPPIYAQLVFALGCMEECRAAFGVPAITFDERLRDPRRAERTLRFWLRGAGGDAVDLGVELQPASRGDERAEVRESGAGGVGSGAQAVGAPTATSNLVERPETDAITDALVREVEFREVFYSRYGDFVQQWVEPGSYALLGTLLPDAGLLEDPIGPWLAGVSTHLQMRWERASPLLGDLVRVTGGEERGRVVLQLSAVDRYARRRLAEHGFRQIRRTLTGAPAFEGELDGSPARALQGSSWWVAGALPELKPPPQLDLDRAEAAMDARDRGQPSEPPERKEMRSFLPVPWDAERWTAAGLPESVQRMMSEGVRIRPEIEPPMADHPFYRWESDEAHMRAIMEADRHLSVGSLEYIPFEEVRGVAETAIVHPWVVARQGEKWRLCHDYSVGTNQYVATAPFALPSPWDVRPCIRADTHLAKYDIRDGFFHVPVHPDSRKYLVVRHPGTGRLMWAPRLPFGYVESPRLFCSLMEAIADVLRAEEASARVVDISDTRIHLTRETEGGG